MLTGKTVVITGAASGIGREGCLLFARNGARIVAVDRDHSGLEELEKEVSETGGEICSIAADLALMPDVKRVIGEAAACWGQIDVLWSNAGVNGTSEIEGFDVAGYHSTVAINLTAGVILSADVLAHMRKRGGGSIIFTASVAGLVGSIQSPIYSATKFAIVGYMKSLALRLAAEGIRVNAICPGPVETPMMEKLIAGATAAGSGAEISRRLVDGVPLGRMARPREIAEAALWLASVKASYVTGVAMPVEGGYTSR